ncbi:MAG: ATP-binding protein, partial [Pseudomonadota bacterium]
MTRIDMASTSIRSQIQKKLIPLVLLCWVGAAVFIYLGTRVELQDALDAQADLLAVVMARMQSDEINPIDFGKGLDRYKTDYIVRIWSSDGQLLFDSQTSLPDGSYAFPAEAKPTEGESGWQITEYRTEAGNKIQIAQLAEETNQIVWQVALAALLPLSLALLGSVLAILYFVRDGLRPLNRLSKVLTLRSASELNDLPNPYRVEELRPIITSLNELFGRIRGFVDRERRFVDDAAHELRTPLTVIKAQCQAIDPSTLDVETKKRLQSIVEGVDRITRLSARLLDQARAEQPASKRTAIQVAPVLRSVLADLTISAEKAGVVIDLQCEEEPEIFGEIEDLRVILSNLAENAIKFASSPGSVYVTLTAKGIDVEDSGSGVPRDQQQQIFDRFYRHPNSKAESTPRGTGLGLSIVQA